MNLYFDTEFESLTQDSKLISIGIVSDDDRELYLEFNDIDVDNQSDWIKQNVLVNTIYYGGVDVDTITTLDNYFVGNKNEIEKILINFIKQYDDVQFVSDVCHYDFVKLINLFGSALGLPDGVSPCCHDINQDIASYYTITDVEAFDMSREGILDDFNKCITLGTKHNALYDARVIKEIYKSILGG